MKELEVLIVGACVHNPDYFERVSGKIVPNLFESEDAKVVFSILKGYADEFKKLPSHDESLVELKDKKGISQDTVNAASEFLRKIWSEGNAVRMKELSMDWLLKKTKKYLTERACYNVIMESLSILDESDKTKGKKLPEAIPDLFAQALSIDFDESIGHDYFDDIEARHDFYTRKEECIPFSLSMLNKVLGGRGMPRRSLVIPIAATGTGKSLFMTDQAAFHVSQGRNVLYISLEMAEEKLAERIDSKLLNLNIWEVKNIPKETFIAKMEKLKQKEIGKIIIKAYAPKTFHSVHLRTLLNTLKKQGFVPDVICIDYLGLMASHQVKLGNVNTNTFLGTVSEELRGVMMDYNCVGIAPMQTNRGGMNNSDPELDAIADSIAVTHTADLIWVMTSTPELEQAGLVRLKLLKNRNGSMTNPNSWTVGIDRAKMSLFDADLPQEPIPKPANGVGMEQRSKLKFG
jgi:replicative DNA helicase